MPSASAFLDETAPSASSFLDEEPADVPSLDPQVVTPEDETLPDRIKKFLFEPEGARVTREAIQSAVESIPQMAVDTAKMGYKGLRMAMGGPEERAKIITEDVIPSALSQGQQTAADIQSPFGTREWLRGAGQLGMMAAPGLELARELRAPAEVRPPLEAPPEIPPEPPVQEPPVATPEASAPSASAFLGEQPAPEVAPPTEPLAPVTPAEAPGLGIQAAFSGKGATDVLYQKAFDALQKGQDTISGVKDPILARHRAAFERGEIRSPEDLKIAEEGKGVGGITPEAQQRRQALEAEKAAILGKNHPSIAIGQRLHPDTEARLAEIDQELGQPPTEPLAPVAPAEVPVSKLDQMREAVKSTILTPAERQRAHKMIALEEAKQAAVEPSVEVPPPIDPVRRAELEAEKAAILGRNHPSIAIGQKLHPDTEARLAEIDQELGQPPTEPLAPVTPPAEAPTAPVIPPEDVRYAGGEPPVTPEVQAQPPVPEETGISKAAIAEQREARDLPAIERQKQIDFGESLDRAKATLAEDPMAGQRLVEELSAKPRAVNPEDTPLLIERMQQVQREFDAANKAVNEAAPEQLEVAKARLEHARGEYDKTVTATQNATSKTGAGLGSLNMILKEDYSLARMESRKRAANNGKISEEQAKEVERLHAEITQQSAAMDALEQLLREGKREAKSSRKLTDFMDEQAAKARERIKARRTRLYADPLGVTNVAHLADEAIIGASHIAKGVTKFADWSSAMIREFGENIKPFLKDLYARSKEMASNAAKITGKALKPKTNELVRRYEQLEKRIAKLKGLAPKEEPRAKREVVSDHDIEVLQTELNRIKTIDKQRAKLMAIKDRFERQVARKKGLLPKVERKKATEVPDAEIEGFQTEINRLRTLAKEARKEGRIIRTPAEARLERYKTALAKQTVGYTAKIQRGDFTKVKRQPPFDPAVYKMKANLQRLKNEFERGVAKDAYRKMSPADKFWQHFVGIQRGFKLSSPGVFEKLGIAAAVREVLAPLEAGGGYGVSKVFPRLAKGTRYGAGLKTIARAEIKAKVALFTEGMKDSWENLKGKETTLEAMSDKYGRQPDFWYNRIGKIHAAVKAPVKRAEFVRSLEHRMDAAVKAGEDINHPEVMDRLATESALDANRAIFQQNTKVSQFFSLLDKTHPAAGRTARFLAPVVRIPVNLFKELVTYHVGAPAAVLKIGHAYWKGVETLPPVAREAIIRQLVKGSVGGAGLLWGYFNRDKVHDFFASVPPGFEHTPIAMAIHEGSIIKGLEEQGTGTRYRPTEAWKEASRMAKYDIPFAYTITGLTDVVSDPEGWRKYLYGMLQGTVVPQAVSWTAKEMDKPTPFSIFDKPTYRQPTNITEAITQGIPGLREDVPEYHPKRRSH